MYSFKINKIYLKSGDVVEPKKLNVIIGANNAGKSRFLKDIRDYIIKHSETHTVMVDFIDYSLPQTFDDFYYGYDLAQMIYSHNGFNFIKRFSGFSFNNDNMDISINNMMSTNNTNLPTEWKDVTENLINTINDLNKTQKYWNGDISERIYNHGSEINMEKLNNIASVYQKQLQEKKEFIMMFGGLFVTYLGTEEKLLSTKTQMNYAENESVINLLSSLKNNDAIIDEISGITSVLFGKKLILDRLTMPKQIRLRVYEKDDLETEAALNFTQKETGKFENHLKQLNVLDDEGDGLKSFVACYFYMYLNRNTVTLIDEPEAFLHPDFAYKLGTIIAQKAKNSDSQLFITTHSPYVLNGILSSISSQDLNIIHVNREGNKNHITSVDSSTVETVVKNQYSTSEGVMSGLFCNEVYITESFSDSYFYRLLFSKNSINRNTIFVNTNGKDQISSLIKLYKSCAVKYNAIYDFDVILTGNDEINRTINVVYESDEEINEIKNTINTIKQDCTAQNYEEKKIKKIGVLAIKDKGLVDDFCYLLNNLKTHQILVHPFGELESSLIEIGIVPCDKKKWIDEIVRYLDENSIQNDMIIQKWLFTDYQITSEDILTLQKVVAL